MGQPAAKQGDRVVGVDTHFVLVPSPSGGPNPVPLPHPFSGMLNGNLSANVNIMDLPAATVGSTAVNTPNHVPAPPGTAFQTPPSDQATVKMGSATVFINGKHAVRNGDKAITCNDPGDLLSGTVNASGTVFIG